MIGNQEADDAISLKFSSALLHHPAFLIHDLCVLCTNPNPKTLNPKPEKVFLGYLQVTEVEKMMAVVEKEKIEKVEPKKAIVMADEAEANKAAAAAKVIKDECEAALAVAMPVLNEALAALDTLSANDINYVKKLANPPYLIKLVLEAVCVILEAKPAKVPDGKGGQLLDYWKPSVTLLNDKNFLQNLKVKIFF
jgi:hypothetical protein